MAYKLSVFPFFSLDDCRAKSAGKRARTGCLCWDRFEADKWLHAFPIAHKNLHRFIYLRSLSLMYFRSNRRHFLSLALSLLVIFFLVLFSFTPFLPLARTCQLYVHVDGYGMLYTRPVLKRHEGRGAPRSVDRFRNRWFAANENLAIPSDTPTPDDDWIPENLTDFRSHGFSKITFLRSIWKTDIKFLEH